MTKSWIGVDLGRFRRFYDSVSVGIIPCLIILILYGAVGYAARMMGDNGLTGARMMAEYFPDDTWGYNKWMISAFGGWSIALVCWIAPAAIMLFILIEEWKETQN